MTNMKITNLLLAGLLSLAAAQEAVAQDVVTKPDVTSPVTGEKISPVALNFFDEVKYSPAKTTFRLFLDWGITFGKPFSLRENAARAVEYAGQDELFQEIQKAFQVKREAPERKDQDNSVRKVIPRTD